MARKITISIVLIVLLGLSGYLGFRLYTLAEDHAALSEDLRRTAHRSDLLQQKYAEQKAQTAALQRAKLTVEGLKRQAEMKAETLEKELERQKAEIAAMQKKGGGMVKALEARLAEKEGVLAQWKAKYAELSEAFQQAKKIIGERDAAIAKMEENTRQLESELQFTTRTRDRYLANNKEMAATAQSILARYDEDGVFAKTLLDVEPFTQIKKVELEQLIQDYLDSIDNQTIRDRE